jgi:hypothetical protein
MSVTGSPSWTAASSGDPVNVSLDLTGSSGRLRPSGRAAQAPRRSWAVRAGDARGGRRTLPASRDRPNMKGCSESDDVTMDERANLAGAPQRQEGYRQPLRIETHDDEPQPAPLNQPRNRVRLGIVGLGTVAQCVFTSRSASAGPISSRSPRSAICRSRSPPSSGSATACRRAGDTRALGEHGGWDQRSQAPLEWWERRGGFPTR